MLWMLLSNFRMRVDWTELRSEGSTKMVLPQNCSPDTLSSAFTLERSLSLGMNVWSHLFHLSDLEVIKETPFLLKPSRAI